MRKEFLHEDKRYQCSLGAPP